MDSDEKLTRSLLTNPGKKVYERPALVVHGSVESITQSHLEVGSGDLFMKQNNLPDVLAS